MFPIGRGERRNSSGRDRVGRTPVIFSKLSFFFFFFSVVRALNRYVFSKLIYRSWCFLFFFPAIFVSFYTFFRVTRLRSTAGLAYRVLILPKDNVLRGNHYSVNIIQMTWTQSARFMLLFYLLGLIAPEFKDWHWYDFDIINELSIL